MMLLKSVHGPDSDVGKGGVLEAAARSDLWHGAEQRKGRIRGVEESDRCPKAVLADVLRVRSQVLFSCVAKPDRQSHSSVPALCSAATIARFRSSSTPASQYRPWPLAIPSSR